MFHIEQCFLAESCVTSFISPICQLVFSFYQEMGEEGNTRTRGLFKNPSPECQSSLLTETSTEAFQQILNRTGTRHTSTIMDLRTKQTIDRKVQEANQKKNEAAEKKR